MNDAEREQLETQVLLRASGELSPAASAALERALAADPAAAEFARFIEGELPSAARAPRDFAAAAIAATRPERNVIAFPRLWKFAAAAAALVLGSLLTLHFVNRPAVPEQASNLPSPVPRATRKISGRAAALESELADARLRLARGRYSQPPEI